MPRLLQHRLDPASRLVRLMCAEYGVPLDLAAMTNQTFMKGKAVYGGTSQSTQIVKLLEDALGTDLRADGFPARLE